MSTQKKKESKSGRVIDALYKQGIVKASAFGKMGVTRAYLSKMNAQGLITRSGRGYYTLPNRSITEHHSLAEAAVAIPDAVICLLSALQFHHLTTQNPHKIWIAISREHRPPAFKGVPIIIVRYSPASHAEGIERHTIEGIGVKIYSVAKTIADCFKFRNKIGIDVALEALRECMQKRLCTVDELWRYARICRVGKIIRPYMEALA